MPELNNIGELLQGLKDQKIFNLDGTKDWTMYPYESDRTKRNVGILTLDTKLGSIDTKTLNELGEVVKFVEESDLDGAILINPIQGKEDKNAVLSAGASLTELYLFIKYGHERKNWDKVKQHLEHGQGVFNSMFESPKQFWSMQLNADTYGGGTELICAMDYRCGTSTSRASAPEYAHGFFPGWNLMFNLRRIIEQNGKDVDAQEEVRRFTTDLATHGYSLDECFERGWGFTHSIKPEFMGEEERNAISLLTGLTNLLSMYAKSYKPQKDLTLITKENDLYQKFIDEAATTGITPEGAIMLNLYEPGRYTALERAKKDNEYFADICHRNANNIIQGLKDKFGTEEQAKNYIKRVGPKEAAFVFEMDDFKHLKPKIQV